MVHKDGGTSWNVCVTRNRATPGFNDSMSTDNMCVNQLHASLWDSVMTESTLSSNAPTKAQMARVLFLMDTGTRMRDCLQKSNDIIRRHQSLVCNAIGGSTIGAKDHNLVNYIT